jgi:hypothetical protein
MTKQEEALAFIQANNAHGGYDSILADYEAGKIDIGLLTFTDQRGLELLKDNNILGRFDDLIATAEGLRKQPVIYISPKAA